MDKKVVFNGIEILTDENDASAKSLLGFVEAVIDRLESDLDRVDDNFHLVINVDFAPNHPAKHSFSLTNLLDNKTRKKVMNILESSTKSPVNAIKGTVRVDLQVQDVS
jgi:hypothetical protein